MNRRRRIAYVRRYRHIDAWCGPRAEAAYTAIIPRWRRPRAATRRAGMCGNRWCGEPAGTRRVTLLHPDGSAYLRCRHLCEGCVDVLLRGLLPSYADGQPAYRVDTVGPTQTVDALSG